MPINVNGFSCTLADGVRETTQTTGTGTYSLGGAATVDGVTYRTFAAALGSGTRTVYSARLGSDFENGIGTITAGAPDTLSRDTILASSNGDNAVSWPGDPVDIMCAPVVAMLHSLQDQIDTVPVAAIKQTEFTSNGTFTPDVKCLFAFVRIVGGGGAGGDADNNPPGQASEGGGGGGGEYAEGWFTTTQLGASQSVTIGVGGTGAGANEAGGTTSFGSLLTAVGGDPGNTGTSAVTLTVGGGVGGTGGIGGSLHIRGGDGSRGNVRDGVRSTTSDGGSSMLSGGTRQSAGPTAHGYGAGGAGASNPANNPSVAGGDGSNGICIVTEFLHR